jgi:hypothetical protein
MRGLDPGIHVLARGDKEDVDGRDKPGHDGDRRPFERGDPYAAAAAFG